MDSSSENARRKKKRDQELKNKIKNMSKEALAAAMSKKKECNARAMMIVEQSIEPEIQEPWLLDNLKHINQSHFQDIVEERAITRICGYPLCIEELTNVPKKMYKISTRENKVYDITDRKNYCSNNCYKAGTFLKDQLFTSPLWLRDCEIPVEYKTLSLTKAGKASGAGAEIDLGNTKPVKLDKLQVVSNSSSSRFGNEETTENNLKHKSPYSHEAPDLKISNISPLTSGEEKKDPDCIESAPLVKEENIFVPLKDINSDETFNLDSSNQGSDCNLNIKTSSKLEVKNESGKEEIICDKNNKLPTRIAKRSQENDEKEFSGVVVNVIEERIESWFTLETMLYLLGPDKVRELLKINGYNEDINPKKEDYTFYLKCQEIYKKLNILELKDKEKQKPSKPVPAYETLKKETKDLELKVKSFFRGDERVRFADEEDEWKTSDGEIDDEPVLPLIDHCSVMSSRRRIFMDKLNKVLPDMQNALELSQFRLGWELQELISTFNLGPTNITLRPPEWTLVAIILIKLLTIRNEILDYAYTRELTQKRLITYLLAYDLDGGYPDRFTAYLMDIERITSIMNVS